MRKAKNKTGFNPIPICNVPANRTANDISHSSIVDLWRCRANRCGGFTLIELLVAFAIVAIVFAAVVPQFRAIRNSWDGTEAGAAIVQNGRVLAEHITRNLSAASQIVSVSAADNANGYISFKDNAGVTKRYSLTGGYVVFGNLGSEEQLAGPVDSFQITCYAINPYVLTTDVNTIRLVQFATIFPNDSALGNDKTFRSEVFIQTSSNANAITYHTFNEAKAASDLTSLAVPVPSGTTTGDLLITAVATDGSTESTISPPAGWTLLDRGVYNSAVTLGAWWKIAGASEAGPVFTWTGSEQAYGWMMRFTGHNAANPINAFSTSGQTDIAPISPAVITTLSNCMILRLGAFDNDNITVDNPGLAGHTAITMDKSGTASSGGTVTYQGFGEGKRANNSTSVVINAPAGISAGNLLIAAVATDGGTSASLAAPVGGGWTLLDRGSDSINEVTLGVWWKLAGASEPAGYTFTWTGNEQAYGWIMRFTGHQPSAPINAAQFQRGDVADITPPCPSVTTTVANTMIVRIGGFDLRSINTDNPGLAGHTAITMSVSTNNASACSGGAGYIQQPAIGASGTVDFTLTEAQRFRTFTLAIAPLPTGTVSGGAGYVKQSASGTSGTSAFTLGSSNEARTLTIAVAPQIMP
jgi:prepilin-type N-terminal cleavage/methylation domain-containing protein